MENGESASSIPAELTVSRSPGQPSILGAAVPAVPASYLLRLAMPMKELAASAACSAPFPDGHIGVAAAHRPGSNLHASAFPDSIVPVTGSDKSVRDFVQDRVQDLFRTIPLHEVTRKLDRATIVHAQAQRLLAPVEAERPVVQSVANQELVGNLADIPNLLG